MAARREAIVAASEVGQQQVGSWSDKHHGVLQTGRPFARGTPGTGGPRRQEAQPPGLGEGSAFPVHQEGRGSHAHRAAMHGCLLLV